MHTIINLNPGNGAQNLDTGYQGGNERLDNLG